MLNEFKSFLIKGNAVDMAVGFIFGAAFGTVVKSLLDNIVMPPVGMMMGDVDFSDMAYTLKEATEGTEAVTVNYGSFITDVISFIILGFIVFMLVRTINNMQKKEDAAPKAPTTEVELLTEMRDLMKKKK